AFVDYRLYGMVFSRVEAEIIKTLIAGDVDAATKVAYSQGPNRERKELEEKLIKLGLPIPWLPK
ncbi:MAG TPA: thymidylate synthase (FAD), partial [Thermoanaerobaculia bacterium]